MISPRTFIRRDAIASSDSITSPADRLSVSRTAIAELLFSCLIGASGMLDQLNGRNIEDSTELFRPDVRSVAAQYGDRSPTLARNRIPERRVSTQHRLSRNIRLM